MIQKEHHIIISLASNINHEANLEAARTQLTQLLSEVHFTSAIYTEPVGNGQCSMFRSALPLGSSKNGQCPKYLNQLCKGTTALGMNLLNEVLKEIEKRLGRTHNEDGIVTVDLDLLEYDGERFHHRDWERNYVKDLINEL
ncbi:MAG: 2-amino-4-hydroxy-6-hydroxymethyldihydropteridine diphosphokinase [Prevotella sp.]|nr:2-amino-4-hydroxy-6-hydroxymethyldihydropteridine diphosphokinase [Prevotella sp.]